MDYLINDKQVIHQAIDGEVVMIQPNAGIYYSLVGSGARIWELLDAGWPTRLITQQLTAWYEGDAEGIAVATREFMAELCNEGLVVAAVPEPGAAPTVAMAEPGSPCERFEAPVLQRFSDMEHILQTDPIHDTTEAGWPHQSSPARESARER